MVRTAQRMTLIAGAFWLPLAVDLNLSDSFILPKLLLARAMLLLLTILVLIRALLERRLVWRRTPLDLPLAAFVVSALLSTVWSVNRNVALFGTYDRYEGLLTIGLYAALFWLTVQSLNGAREGSRVLTALILGAYTASIIGLVAALLTTASGVGPGESAFTFGGIARASGTMGNPNLLATLLAMSLPLAVWRLLKATSIWQRVGWLNVATVMSFAHLMTFSRAGIIAAVAAAGLVVGGDVGHWKRRRIILAVCAVVVILPVSALALGRGGISLGSSIESRVASMVQPMAGSNATRLHVWIDSLQMISGRPLIGFGPDTFGLVYPRFASGDWTPGYRVDKAHADLLQVGVTQGMVGVGSDLALIIAAIVMFWKRRREPLVALFAGWVGYQTVTAVNFSWLPAALLFWIFLGAAVVMADSTPRRLEIHINGRGRQAASILGMAACIGLCAPLIARPFLAESSFSSGLEAQFEGQSGTALQRFEDSRRLSPENSTYAVAEGNLLLMSGRLAQARENLSAAIALGTEDPTARQSTGMLQKLPVGN